MARLRLTKEQVESLEVQTTQAHKALRKGMETKRRGDIVSAAALYHDLKESLVAIAGYSSGQESFMSWTRGTYRANLLDRYLLQYVLSSSLMVELERGIENEPKRRRNDRVTGKSNGLGRIFTPEEVKEGDNLEEGLILMIDDKKIGYASIALIAENFVTEGYGDRLLVILEDIRSIYRKPYLEFP